MRRLRVGLNVLLLGLVLSGTVLASDVSDATNEGVITVSNSGTAAANVAAVFSLTSSEWVDNGYFDSDYNNVAIQAGSGADVAFMPGASPPLVRTPIVPLNSCVWSLIRSDCSGSSDPVEPGPRGGAVNPSSGKLIERHEETALEVSH